MRFIYHILILAGAVGLIGCAPLQGYHGNDAPDDKLAQIRPNVSGHAEVNAALGSPNTTSLDGKRLWLYVSYETYAWLPTFETESARRIVAVHFKPDGKVRRIRKLSAINGRIIDFVPDTTPTPIAEVNWIQRLFSNIGRVTPGNLPGSNAP